jgi:hypothetical protein
MFLVHGTDSRGPSADRKFENLSLTLCAEERRSTASRFVGPCLLCNGHGSLLEGQTYSSGLRFPSELCGWLAL